MIEPKRQRGIKTRDRIAYAAALEFAEHGYAGTSYGSIAQRAGVTRGIVQNWAPAKNQLAEYVVDQVFVGGGFAAASRSAHLTGVDQLLFSAWNLAAQIIDDPMIRGALRLLGEWRVINSPEPKRFTGWIDLASGDLSSAVSAGDMPSELNCDEVAWLLIAAFMGVKTMTESLGTFDTFQERCMDILFSVLRGNGYQGTIENPVAHVKELVDVQEAVLADSGSPHAF